MKKVRLVLICLLSVATVQLSFTSCTHIDLFEKSVTLSGHQWNNTYKPSFTFNIKDTSSAYNLFIVLRHNDKYNYNNIYLNLITKQPGQDTTQKVRYDLTLATDEEGWRGTGMDDIYEHRIPLTPANQQFRFIKSGDYTFTLEQIMRDNPLKNVLNVGLRIEKKQ
ncbi:MAG: gliding motility lipoprotein GldH [Chitinophagaceae bacterium]